jgi:phage shock protein E
VQKEELKSGYKQVSMEEGLELMKEDSGYILLDIRGTDELKRTYSWINQYSQ